MFNFIISLLVIYRKLPWKKACSLPGLFYFPSLRTVLFFLLTLSFPSHYIAYLSLTFTPMSLLREPSNPVKVVSYVPEFHVYALLQCMVWFSHWVASNSCNPVDSSRLSSSLHKISQASYWVAVFFSRGSSQTRDRSDMFCITDWFSIAEPPGIPNTVHTNMYNNCLFTCLFCSFEYTLLGAETLTHLCISRNLTHAWPVACTRLTC